MKFVTYVKEHQEKVGIIVNDLVYDLTQINPHLPSTLIELLADSAFSFPLIELIQKEIASGNYKHSIVENP
ncbi:MAG TPA: fumarylacetoacetate hydrolase family protein, partial [Faecalibacter sp.]